MGRMVATTGKGAVGIAQLAAVVIVEGRSDAAPTETRPCDTRDMLGRGITLDGIAILAPDLGALVVLAQDDVDDTGHGIGAINGRGPITQHLDALHGGGGQAVEIHEGVGHALGKAIIGKAPPIDEHQRAVLAEAAQTGPGASGCKAVGVGLVE